MKFSRRLTGTAVLFAAAIFATANFVLADAPTEKEAELIAVLKSDAPSADKAVTCKKLAIVGSSAAVPELAKLLPDEQLSSWTRIALEAIPGPEADEALRKATESLNGLLLIGTINSIGVRRDAGAVELLAARLNDTNTGVAAAAAVALGHIGNSAAAKSLQAALTSTLGHVRSAVAEGCVLCAERFYLAGNEADAVALYDVVRKAEVPQQRILEATRGAILARQQKGLALLMEQFRSPDIGLFNIALSTAREFPGREVDDALAKELSELKPERAALVVVAMADRPQTVILPAVLKAAKSGPKPVRIAAIAALGRVGDTTCLSTLLDCAIEAEKDAQAALKAAPPSEKDAPLLPEQEFLNVVKTALADIPGESIDKDIIARLAKPDPKTYITLLELVGERRIDAIPTLLSAVENSDKAVRSAALTSLGATVPPDKLSILIKQVVSAKNADDGALAQVALKTACIRMPDREACSAELASALDRAPTPTKIVLLKILAAVAGTKALNTVGEACRNSDPQLQDVGSQLLGDWMTIDAAPVLLDLAKTAPAEKFQIRAMRGYIKVVRQFTMPEPQRMEMCHLAMSAARRTDERKLVIEVLKRYPNMETMKMAVKAYQEPELKEEAAQAALAIAQAISGKSPEVGAMLVGIDLNKIKLHIVKAEYGSGATQKDVTEILQKCANNTQLITLSSPTYNETFGGDPAPNMPKLLKIQYTIDDKPSEVSLPENGLIILPMPKLKKQLQ